MPPYTTHFSVDSGQNRLYWIDYLRSINILGTIFFHAFLAYSPVIQSLDYSYLANFPFIDPNTTLEYVDLILLLRPMFSMQLMFFISGLFAWRSLQKGGALAICLIGSNA
jgi:glucans biosynthesis protein C